jgi:chaperone required for assembly of F1-ATPase
MRELFEDALRQNPLDPMESARRNLRPTRKRFYREVSVAEAGEGYEVRLDGKPIRTPARRSLALPARELADVVAGEWREQGDFIEPRRMPLTRLANTIIDGVADSVPEVVDEVAKYLGADLLVYRAEGPDGLTQRQGESWDPVLAWAQETLGAQFFLSAGVMHVPQPQRALAAAAAAIPHDPWLLGAVHTVTTLTGSALLALALLRGRLTAEETWSTANVDEDWQMEQWGEDELAMQRGAFRWAEMQAAAVIITALREQSGAAS